MITIRLKKRDWLYKMIHINELAIIYLQHYTPKKIAPIILLRTNQKNQRLIRIKVIFCKNLQGIKILKYYEIYRTNKIIKKRAPTAATKIGDYFRYRYGYLL
ncbi:MAG: hypothetical protein BWX63_01386 [Bacteroidetes bacterium ADurb.Bin041]|jgi:hypothetical protein|nr:MAG: hypothetical protein BWX63_01386 [Bacteroidetes bacterium ADurb.Bin041]